MPELQPKTDPKSKAKTKQPTLVKGNGKATDKPKPARMKQADLPTMENREIPEIEQAADAYREVRDDRCELSKQESTAKARLIEVMKKYKRTLYSYNGLMVDLTTVDNVKVRSDKKNDDEEDE
jgi:hypothetical protein